MTKELESALEWADYNNGRTKTAGGESAMVLAAAVRSLQAELAGAVEVLRKSEKARLEAEAEVKRLRDIHQDLINRMDDSAARAEKAEAGAAVMRGALRAIAEDDSCGQHHDAMAREALEGK